MKDLRLTRDGDLFVGPYTGLEITDSVAQAITVRLRWFFQEWRFAPEFGVPYFEEILVKNPNKLRITQIIREEVLSVEEVEEVKDISVEIQPNRTALVRFKAQVNGNFSDIEVVVDVE
jgi:hypothetical protein